MSPHHSSSSFVTLVLNLQTGHVMHQYHVMFDDTFSAVEYLQSGKAPNFWDELVQHNTEHFGHVGDPSDTILDIEQEELLTFDTSTHLDANYDLDMAQDKINLGDEIVPPLIR